ncbi:hypothetical protein FQR65_LT07563 [Abscondita terminalis]|nr:hypothetical protein FQR65_LT07563 [Abscondita terminalis]
MTSILYGILLTSIWAYTSADTDYKVIGGSDAAPGEFPYHVSLQTSFFRHFCGGSIIGPRWILTAAHCVNHIRGPFNVLVGTNLLNYGGRRYPVKRYIVHQRYTMIGYKHDIALVELQRNIISPRIIALPNTFPRYNSWCVLTGWGYVSTSQKFIPNKLQKIWLTLISPPRCSFQLSLPVLNTNVCTISRAGRGACTYDSGGPLVCNSVQTGVVSWGIPCALGRPDVYTSVASYRNWIKYHTGSFSALQTGLNDGWPSFVLPQLLSTIPVTSDEASWIASIYPIGTVAGSILLTLIFGIFGRRTIVLVGSLLFGVTWLIIAFGRTSWELYVARFIAGLLDGVTAPCLLLYLAEVSDTNIRGFLITGTKIFYISGIFLANLLGAFLTIFQVAITSSVMSLGVLLGLLVPESPYFYMAKNDDSKAKIIVQNESKDDVNPIIFVSVYYALQIIVMIINGIIIDKIGRKPLLVASMSTVVVSLMIVSAYFTLENVTTVDVSKYSWCPVFGLFLYIIGYSLGLQNVPYIIIGEIFPLHVKSVAAGLFCVVYGISAAVVSKLFQYTKDEFGIHVPFIIFAISSICSIPFFVYCVPETKKKTLEEIEKDIRLKETSNVN